MGTISLTAALAALTGDIDLSGADNVALPDVTCGAVTAGGNVGVTGHVAASTTVTAGTTMTTGTGLTVTAGDVTVTDGDVLLTAAPSVVKIAGVQVVPSL